MTRSHQRSETEVVEGVCLYTTLNLPDPVRTAPDAWPNIRTHRPEDVPDTSCIRFAVVWQPTYYAFGAFPNVELVPVIVICEDGTLRFTGDTVIPQVAAQSDIVINILRMTNATRNILNAHRFDVMPNRAVLLQLGRGRNLVKNDLLKALASDQLSAASFDVFRVEPLPKDHPYGHFPALL